MAYEKLNLEEKATFTAEHVAHIEQGILDIEKKLSEIVDGGVMDGNEVEY